MSFVNHRHMAPLKAAGRPLEATRSNLVAAASQPTSAASDPVTVWSDAVHSVCLISHMSAEFNDVMRLRSDAYRLAQDKVTTTADSYSDIYVLRSCGSTIATVSSTRGTAGRFDCHEFYPAAIVRAFQTILVSPYRLAVAPEHQGSGGVARQILLRGWEHQVRRGARMMIINVHEPMIPYYRRMGFRMVRDSSFIHPRLGTTSHVAVCATDPCGGRGLEKAVHNVENAVTYDQIAEHGALDP
jgi:GNAT superfamily N-acetyltransferase